MVTQGNKGNTIACRRPPEWPGDGAVGPPAEGPGRGRGLPAENPYEMNSLYKENTYGGTLQKPRYDR